MLMEHVLALDITYSQVAVFHPSLKQPFNIWTDRHVAQGFAWRPGSVSFSTIDEGGVHTIRVSVISSFVEISPAAIRVIEVPFRVPSDGSVEIASISDSQQF